MRIQRRARRALPNGKSATRLHARTIWLHTGQPALKSSSTSSTPGKTGGARRKHPPVYRRGDLYIGLPNFMVAKVSPSQRRQLKSPGGHYRVRSTRIQIHVASSWNYRRRSGFFQRRRGSCGEYGDNSLNTREYGGLRGFPTVERGGSSPNLERRIPSGRSKPADSAFLHCAAPENIREREMCVLP